MSKACCKAMCIVSTLHECTKQTRPTRKTNPPKGNKTFSKDSGGITVFSISFQPNKKTIKLLICLSIIAIFVKSESSLKSSSFILRPEITPRGHTQFRASPDQLNFSQGMQLTEKECKY